MFMISKDQQGLRQKMGGAEVGGSGGREARWEPVVQVRDGGRGPRLGAGEKIC